MKIDLGCGNDKKQGYTGLNYPETSDSDIVHDLTNFPYPIDDDSVHRVYCDNVLEHFDREEVSEIMGEIVRICEDGAVVEICVPHYLHKNSAAGNHKSCYSSESFNCYLESHDYPVKDIPQNFRLISVDNCWRNQKIVSLIRSIFPDSWVASFVPNTVDELVFKLEVVKGKSGSKGSEIEESP